jgi:protocatechuate 3,4-dioxygenase beta subunit
LRPSDHQQQPFDIESAGYRAGDEGIKLVVEPAGSIEGKISGGGTNQTPLIARLALQSDQPIYYFTAFSDEPVQSGIDGTFVFKNVAAGSYHVHAVFGTNGSSEWVADTAPVTVEAGQVARGVELTAMRGAVLEVSVLGQDDHQPVAKVNVNVSRENFQASAVSDKTGMARLLVSPGNYQVMAFQRGMPASPTTAAVAAGMTNRVEIDVAGPKMISGIVHTADGQPAAHLRVQLVGGFGRENGDMTTDANGKFELEWNAQQFPGQGGSTACVLVRDVEHDQAAAQDIDEDTTTLDLKLAPALTLVGRAQAGGNPITNATAQLVFWTGNRGTWLPGLARTNMPGQYEIHALPPGRKYGVIVSAPGYGQKQLFIFEVSPDPGRQELDTVELMPANLKLAGQVLDADDKPVAGCNVNLNGDGQPNAHTRTDREGRFFFAQVCDGALQVSANGRNVFGNISAEGGDTNVILHLGQNYGSSPGAQTHKLQGVVTDGSGQPVAAAQVAVFPGNGNRWVKSGPGGEYHLTWSLQPWQTQNGGTAYLVVRDAARDLAGVEELPEDTTNLDMKLKPAFTFSGLVKDANEAPMPGAQIGFWFKAGNTYDQLDEQTRTADSSGRYEIKCLPADGQFIVYASAKGYGKSQQQVGNDTETNRVELAPLVLKLADQVIAGQVLKDDDKPASGVNINLNGDGQPDGNMTTDSKGRFHFQVCEGQIRLFAFSQYGGGNGQATVEAGDTNIVINLSSSPMGFRQPPRRASLKGGALPDLTSANLAADAAPAGQAVLLCLFDAGQRPSRHVVQLLEQQTAGLRQKNVVVLGVQSAAISDDSFNAWKSAGTVSFPVGRVTDKNEKTKWASATTALPWLILADATHRVVAEGFSMDELDAQIQKLGK